MENIEKTYPIYRFTARWSEISKDKSYEEYPNWKKGLPKDRIWNSTSWTKMYKEEQDLKELEGWMMQWWDEYLTKKDNEDKAMKLLYLKVEFFQNETWHLTWFQHETFDEGQTDEEALQSFERFVRRKELLNEKKQWEEGKDEYCLMGAEDRWRWHGAEPNGQPDDHSPAPCRCKHCKEQGMIRIAH
ncbi:MAG: hypothetical protein M0R03_22925 [Novosphingobium sp.]|nr:hypothetical protein [Novosphingobium sp.]